MKLCWHDWKVWSTLPNKTKVVGYAALGTVLPFVFVALVTDSTINIVIMLYLLATMTLCILNIVHTYDSDINYGTYHEDKTCLKCNKHVFDASKEQKRLDTKRHNEIEREMMAVNFPLQDFQKKKALYLKAN